MHSYGQTRIVQAIRKEGEEKMTTETQGKTEENIISQDTKQKRLTELVSPKAGTATSSPTLQHRPSQIKCLRKDTA